MVAAAPLLMNDCNGREEDLTHGHGFTNQNDLFAAMVSGRRSLHPLLVSYTDDVYVSLYTLAFASRDLLLQRQQVALPTPFDDRNGDCHWRKLHGRVATRHVCGIAAVVATFVVIVSTAQDVEYYI